MTLGNKEHEAVFCSHQETNRTGNSALGKQAAVAKEPANKQSEEKKRLGVNQPEGTRAQSVKHRELFHKGARAKYHPA